MSSRRDFIKTTALGTAGILSSAPFADSFALDIIQPPADLYTLSEGLLKQWGKALIDLQITNKADTLNYGGIYCPANKTVHGRIGDAIYPFFYLADKTKDSRYIDSAMLLYRWMDSGVSQPDGSWLNEPVKNSWKGTTVFSSIALAETLKNYGHLLDSKFKNELSQRLIKAGEYIYSNFSVDYGNINYPVTASYALSLIGTLLNVPKFVTKGREFAHAALRFMTAKDTFLQGEGGPYDKPSPKGCFSVDLGYNVEESLPSLVLYGLYTKDNEVLDMVTRSMRTHMEFMLPDGAWDNSWGTRNFKWTYWGSRTTDGCQAAYTLLADRDPRFYKVALKNTQLLQSCTKNGLLYGGPHYISHGVTPCVHHTFSHIKALTTILDYKGKRQKPVSDKVLLPRERVYGSKFSADIQTHLIAKSHFKATVTGYDRAYKQTKMGHATGGALTMLWHPKTGPIFSGSMNRYQLFEADNMQPDTDPLSMPLTPRIELKLDDEVYMNICDLNAQMVTENINNEVIIKTHSKLVDKDQKSPDDGDINCRVTYRFADNKVSIQYSFDKSEHDGQVKIIFPVISASTEKYTLTDKLLQVQKPKSTVKVTANQKITLLPTTVKKRVFNFVPGLEAIPVCIINNNATIVIEVV
jgi:hypothetical protein